MRLKKNRQRIWFLLILCVFTCFAWVRQARQDALLSPYQEVDTLEGVWIEAKPGTVTPWGVVIRIQNATERGDLYTGVQYVVEEKKGNRWYTIPDSHFSFEGPAPLLAISFPTASEIRLADKMRQEPVLGSERREWSSRRRAAYARTERAYDWTWAGALLPGEYRLLLEVDSEYDNPLDEDYVPWYLSAPFTIP